jgi:hypothetical protein
MMSQDPLDTYFDFDEADLFANRNGYLTDRQKTRMATQEQFAKRFFLGIAIFLFGVGIVPTIIVWLSNPSRTFPVIWSSLWIPTWGFFGFLVARMALSTRKAPLLKKAEGPVNIVMEDTDSTDRDYELHVGGETFDADSELADIMMQGDVYAVYYIDGINEIVSAEMLAKRK